MLQSVLNFSVDALKFVGVFVAILGCVWFACYSVASAVLAAIHENPIQVCIPH